MKYLQFLRTPNHMLKQRTYNIGNLDFTPQEVTAEIQKHFPQFSVNYDVNPLLQSIGELCDDVNK